MAAIQVKFRLREDGVVYNDCWIEDRSTYDTTDTLVVYNPRNTVIYSATVGDADAESESFALSTDVDGNVISGTWKIVIAGDIYSFAYTDEYFIANVRQDPDGYSSTFTSVDTSDYSNWNTSTVSRTHTVTPPTESPSTMVEVSNGTATVYYGANIFSGEYTSELDVDVYRDITSSGTITDGVLRVYDNDIYEVSVNVYNLSENTVFGEIKDFYEEYEDELSTAPKRALDKQPALIKIGNCLQLYMQAMRGGDLEEMYTQLLTVMQTLNPDYLTETPDVEEIIPFELTEVDHTHNNKTTILDLFTLGDGDDDDDLYFNGVLVGTESNKVLASGSEGEVPGYLNAKVDNVSIEVSSNKLAIKDDYIASLAGDGLTYSDGQFSVTSSGSGTDDDDDDTGNYVEEWDATRTYAADDMVYVTSGGAEKMWVALQASTNVTPATGAYWSEATFSAQSHAQNTDTQLGNIYTSLDADNIASSIQYGAGGDDDTEWYLYNHIRLDNSVVEASSMYGIFGKPTQALSDIDLPTQDVTFVYYGTVDFTIEDTVEVSGTIPAGGVGFYNKGYTVMFNDRGDWARYRYNHDTGYLDLVETNLDYSVTDPKGGTGIDFDDLSVEEGAGDDDDVFEYDGAGKFTLDLDLSKYDNTTSAFLDAASFATEFNTNFGAASLNDLGYKRHSYLTNLNDDISYMHVTATEKSTWNAKQAAITGAATTIDTEDLTASRALVSSASGKVEVSVATAAEVGYLANLDGNIQTQIDSIILNRSLSYEIFLPAGATLGVRIADPAVVKPSAWSLSTAGDGTDLEVTHNLSLIAEAIVYQKDMGTSVRTKLTGATAYNTLTVPSNENSFTLTSFAPDTASNDVYIKILF